MSRWSTLKGNHLRIAYTTICDMCYIVIYTFMHHNDTTSKTDAWINDACRKTQEGRHRRLLFKYIYLSLYCKDSKGLFKGLHVRECWRLNINFIFWPHCYDRHGVFLVLLMLGSTPSGVFRGPPRSGVAFPSTSGLYCLELYWELHRGFPRSPSVGCGLPYHISSLTLWESAGNCIGGFPSAPSVGCGLPYRIWSLLSGSLLATALGPKLNWVK